MKLNLNFTAVTLLKDWWKTVKENFEAIEAHSTETVIDHPDKSVTTAKIAPKAVDTEQIADYAVGVNQLAQGAVNNNRITNGAINTRTIADKAVTKVKLSEELQTQLDDFQTHIDNPSEEIADDSVTISKLADDVITKIDKAYIQTVPIELPEYTYDTSYSISIKEGVSAMHIYCFEAEQYVDTITDIDFTYAVHSCVDDDGYIRLGERVFLIFSEDTDGYGNRIAYIVARMLPVDSELSDTSENPVQNKVVTAAMNEHAEKYGGLTYGHVRLLDSTEISLGVASGVAATPKAVAEVFTAVETVYAELQALAERVSALEG